VGVTDDRQMIDDLSRGPYLRETRAALEKASFTLAPIVAQHPKIDARYVLAIVRGHLHLALGWPSREGRKIWKRLLVDVNDLERVCWGADGGNEEAGGFPLLRKELENIRNTMGLPHIPEPSEPDDGGRPDVFWSNVLAYMLKDHLEHATGTPQWRVIAALFGVGPAIPNTVMDEEHIRQRLVLAAREGHMAEGRPSVSFTAQGLRYRYQNEGAINF
jgi:hypothetical protein